MKVCYRTVVWQNVWATLKVGKALLLVGDQKKIALESQNTRLLAVFNGRFVVNVGGLHRWRGRGENRSHDLYFSNRMASHSSLPSVIGSGDADGPIVSCVKKFRRHPWLKFQHVRTREQRLQKPRAYQSGISVPYGTLSPLKQPHSPCLFSYYL